MLNRIPFQIEAFIFKFKANTSGHLYRRHFAIAACAGLALPVVVTTRLEAAVPAPGNWSLRYADEFNGNTLDTLKWNYNYPWGNTHNYDASVSPTNVSVHNGLLDLQATNTGNWTNGTYYNFSSAAINTNGKLNVTYGFIEARQQMAWQQGTWPAFWMLQNGWPPEIDIQEVPAFGQDPWSYYATYHYGTADASNNWNPPSVGTGSHYAGSSLAYNYHNYAVDWEPNSLTFYFDGTAIYTATGSQANIAQAAGEYLLINLGVGGWPGEPANPGYFPAHFTTDWVRVWQKDGAAQSGWNKAANGNWDDSSAWNNGVPNLSATNAYFGAQTGNPGSITVDFSGSRTVNSLTFNAPSKYIVGAVANGGSALMLSAADGVSTAAESVSITQTAATTNGSVINARLEIPYALLTVNLANSASAPITLNGDIIGPGNLSATAGASIINGTDSRTGSTSASGGATLTINGNLTATSNLLINTANVAINTGAAVTTTAYSSVGATAGSNANLTLAGNLTVNGDFNVADVSATAGMTLTGNLAVSALYIGKFGTSRGTLTQTAGAIISLSGNDWRIGGANSAADSAAVGIYNLAGGSITHGGNFQVGAYGTGTVKQTGGSANIGSYLAIGRYAGGNGLWDLSSGNGTLTANSAPYLIVGEQGTGTLLVGGSSIVNAKAISIAHSDGTNASGSVVQTGGTVNAVSGVVFGAAASGTAVATGSYNLSGGILNTASISQNALATVSGTLIFNGGVIQPTASNTNFISGLTSAKISQRGAIFNTAGFNVTVNQLLTHDVALDGGLTKSGNGVLTLKTAGNSYTGATNISAGTLQLSTSNNILPASASLNLSSASAVLDINSTSQSTGLLSGVVGSSILLGSGSLAVSSSTNSQFDGNISGSGSFTKLGSNLLTLTAVNSYTGATAINNGSLYLKQNASLATSAITIGNTAAVYLAGNLTAAPTVTDLGTLIFNASTGTGITVRQLGTLTIGNPANPLVSSTAMAAPNHANRQLITTAGLVLNGALNSWTSRLDLTNNDLDIKNGNLATVTNQVKTAYKNGGWNGNGLTSFTAASDTTHLTALGVIQNSVDGSPLSTPLYGSSQLLGTFDTLSPPATDVLVKYTYVGDANMDGRVDGSDYARIDASYLTSATGWFNGDFNYDGFINGSDYTLLDNAFNTQNASLSATTQIAAQVASPLAIDPAAGSPFSAASSVPEPAGLTLFGVLTTSLSTRTLRRRRRTSI